MISRFEFKLVAEPKKRTRRRKWPANLKCAVCGTDCTYAFYGVHCCEGCKQFFRRTIVNQSRWICEGNGQCGEVKYAEFNCKACRFDKCLSAGMNWGSIEAIKNADTTNEFFEELKRKRQKIMAKKQQQQLVQIQIPNDENVSESFILANLLRIQKCHRKLYCAYFSLPDTFLQQFDIHNSDFKKGSKALFNILNMAECFPETPVPYDPENEYVTRDYFSHPRFMKKVAMDCLLTIGVAMAMPVFSKLSPDDQSILIRNVIKPVSILVNSYYSAQNGLQVWGHSDGFISVKFYDQMFPNLHEDLNLQNLIEQMFVHSMQPFFRIWPLATEEFVLMLAILHSHSAASDLSTVARELLYSESVRYSKMLLKWEQLRYGPEAGARRYSECLLLLEKCHHGTKYIEMLGIYIETFYCQKNRIEYKRVDN